MICQRCGKPTEFTGPQKYVGQDIVHSETGLTCCDQAYRVPTWEENLDKPKQMELAEVYGVIEL